MMPNKKRNAKLRDKFLLSGAAMKNEHVRSTLRGLIKKSRIENDDKDDYVPLEGEGDDGEVINLEHKPEATIPVVQVKQEKVLKVNASGVKGKAGTGKNGAPAGKITKKNKKNKYFLLAHPELKEKVKEGNKFVVNKEVVEKKFLVEQSNGNSKSSNAASKGSKHELGPDDEYANLWVLEPYTSSSEDEDEKEKKVKNEKKKKNKRKAGDDEDEEKQGLPSIKFETKMQTLEDGTVVETFTAVDGEAQDEDEEVEEETNGQEEIEEQEETNKKKKKKKGEEQQQQPKMLSEAQQKLQSSRFRYLNELLYTKKSDESFDYFKNDSDAFKAYHQGFQSQTTKWPVNPLDVIIKAIKAKSSNSVIADFGCGEAKLAQSLINHKVHSFDFVALNDSVTACDMKKVPLNSKSCDIVVFCLSLMGVNISEFLCEAHRVLKLNGFLKVAEVASRFENVQMFIKNVESIGFKCISKEIKSGSYFYFFDFVKNSNDVRSKGSLIQLTPCLYKKR